MRFILASSSPRRRELIASLGFEFEIIKPDVDETQHADENPYEFVERVSNDKAKAVVQMVSQQNDDTVILAADTIVVAADTIGVDFDGELLGKPENDADARGMLQRLRGISHTVCTAIQVIRLGDEAQQISQQVRTLVTMRDYSDAEIDAYIATGDPMDKAGSYAIQHPVFRPVDHIDGCYNNVVGLPLCAVKQALSEVGFLNNAPVQCDCPPYIST